MSSPMSWRGSIATPPHRTPTRTRAELDAAPDAYALTPDALDHLDDVHAVIERVMPALFGCAVLAAFCLMVTMPPIPHPSRGTRALFRRLRGDRRLRPPRRMGDDRLQQLLRRAPFAVLRGGNMDVPLRFAAHLHVSASILDGNGGGLACHRSSLVSYFGGVRHSADQKGKARRSTTQRIAICTCISPRHEGAYAG